MTNLKNTIYAGALALLSVGCASMDKANGPVVVVGKEQEAYIVQSVDQNDFVYRVPFVIDTSAQIGDTIDLSYVTKGKIKPMKGGQ